MKINFITSLQEENGNRMTSLEILTEANLNRITKGHEDKGYVIVSACRNTMWKNKDTGKITIFEPNKDLENYEELNNNETQDQIDVNNQNTKQLRKRLYLDGFSFIPVFGGFKEAGSDKASIEKSFIVYPFNYTTKEECPFNIFIEEIYTLAAEFNQDSVLVKAPGKNPRYYLPKTGEYADDIEFTGMSLNDVTKEYFTALKKWSDSSKKNDFSKGSPQRWTFEAYIFQRPGSIMESHSRALTGEMVAY